MTQVIVQRDLAFTYMNPDQFGTTEFSFAKQSNSAKYGDGTLWLTGANTYTGPTNIYRGVLKVSSLNSVNSGGGGPPLLSSSLGRPTTDADGIITFGRFYQDFAEPSNPFMGHAGTLLYTGASGETTDRQIRLNWGDGGAVIDQSGGGLLKFSNSNVAMVAGVAGYSNSKTLTLQGSTAGTGEIAGSIVDGSGGTTNITSLAKAGTGTWTLSGANTYTGATTVSGGVLNLGIAEIVGASGPLGKSAAANPGSIVLTDGTLQYSDVNHYDYSGRFSTAINQHYNVDTNGHDVTWETPLTSSGGTLSKSGDGTLTLSGANTYTGTTTINNGALLLGEGGSMGATAVSVTTDTTYGMATTFSGAPVPGGKTLSLASGAKLSLQDGYANTMSFTETGALSAAKLYFDLGSKIDGVNYSDKLELTGAATVSGDNKFYFSMVTGESLAVGN